MERGRVERIQDGRQLITSLEEYSERRVDTFIEDLVLELLQSLELHAIVKKYASVFEFSPIQGIADELEPEKATRASNPVDGPAGDTVSVECSDDKAKTDVDVHVGINWTSELISHTDITEAYTHSPLQDIQRAKESAPLHEERVDSVKPITLCESNKDKSRTSPQTSNTDTELALKETSSFNRLGRFG